MRCFTDDELRRGLAAVIADHDRCTICGDTGLCTHPAPQAHAFVPPDALNLFLEAARRDEERAEHAHGDGDPP